MSKLNTTQIKIEKLITNNLPSIAGRFIKAKRDCMKDSSLYAYALDLEAFFKYLSDNLSIPVKEISIQDIENVTASDIENYIEESRHYIENETIKTRSDAAVSRRYIVLKMFYNFLYFEGMIDSLEILRVLTPKSGKKPPKIPEKTDVSALINFISNEKMPTSHACDYQAICKNRDIAIIVLIVCAGLKGSECVSLNIGDLHLDEGYINVQERRYSHVTISYYVSQCISKYLEERLTMIPVYGDELALFLSLRGSRMSLRAVQKMIKKYSSTLFGEEKSIAGKDLHTSFRDQIYNTSKSLSTTALLSNCSPETLHIFYKADINERTADTAKI